MLGRVRLLGHDATVGRSAVTAAEGSFADLQEDKERSCDHGGVIRKAHRCDGIRYLLPSVNLKLRPKLVKELKVGSRIVSHSFDMGDWQPDKTEEEMEWQMVRLWIVTEKAKAAYGGE